MRSKKEPAAAGSPSCALVGIDAEQRRQLALHLDEYGVRRSSRDLQLSRRP
jgi:hypothetical protein